MRGEVGFEGRKSDVAFLLKFAAAARDEGFHSIPFRMLQIWKLIYAVKLFDFWREINFESNVWVEI